MAEKSCPMSSGQQHPPVTAEGKPLKPCCACPETRKKRDECVLQLGSEEACSQYIEAHKTCLRSYGFIID